MYSYIYLVCGGYIKKEVSIKKGKYRHFQGKEYKVIDIARHSESLEYIVIYQALYGDFGIWVRPLSMFLEDVEVEGKVRKRFEHIENELPSGSYDDILNSCYKLFEATSEQADVLDTKLKKFNADKLKFTGEIEQEINYVIRDQKGEVIAGIRGYCYLEECLLISMIFVDEDKRKQGLGNMLLQAIEEKSRLINVRLIHLETFDFQAKDFYLKNGYKVFATLDDCPEGHKSYYMKKIL